MPYGGAFIVTASECVAVAVFPRDVTVKVTLYVPMFEHTWEVFSRVSVDPCVRKRMRKCMCISLLQRRQMH